jgi:membrane protein required for colicin V production
MEPHTGLNIVDYSVIGIILLSGLLALMRGFVREVLSLAAWVGAYFIAAKEYKFAEPWTHKLIRNETGSTALAAVIIFVVALTVLTLAGYFIARLIRGRTLTSIDRSLGFLFGLFRGALIVCLVYLGASYIPWLNMDKLDKAEAPPQIYLDTANTAPAEPDKDKDKDKAGVKDESAKDNDKPPELLVEAKTRPAMAYGANILRAYIPEKAIEQTMQKYDDKYQKAKTDAHQAVDTKTEQMLGVPGKPPPPADEKKDDTTSYNNQDRSTLNNLVNQQGNQ